MNPMTVLYIEDNLINARLVEKILARRPGATLHHAPNAEVGLRMAADAQPDVILLDLHLPDLDGEAVLERLRASASTSTIPVVVVSADAMPDSIERVLAGGASAYLTKPLNVHDLLAVLEGATATPG